MTKISSYEALLEKNANYKKLISIRVNSKNKPLDTDEKHILICGGTGCKSSNADKILSELNNNIEKYGLGDKVKVIMAGCFGFCAKGPIVKIEPDDTFYVQVNPNDAEEIIKSHIIEGKVVERLLFTDPSDGKKIKSQHNIPFYKKQMRIALRNCGVINPENIKEYIAADGYKALGNVLTNYEPIE